MSIDETQDKAKLLLDILKRKHYFGISTSFQKNKIQFLALMKKN